MLDYSFHTFDFDNLARTSKAGKILLFEEKLERKQFIAGIGGLPGSRGDINGSSCMVIATALTTNILGFLYAGPGQA